jgi:hypothetical protein
MSDGAQGTGSGGPGEDGGSNGDLSGADVGPHHGGEDSGDREAGGASSAPGSSSAHEVHGAYAVETPEQLLGEVATVRRKTRLARHAYWFPLVLFGLLTCAAIPFYLQPEPRKRSCVYAPPDHVCRVRGTAPPPFRPVLPNGYLGGFGGTLVRSGTSFYWLAALLAGLAVTALWYRWRGARVGLRTPARGYLVIGFALLVLALVVPVLADHDSHSWLRFLMPGDLLIRGTFPFMIIAVGLCVLAWAERSIALTIIAVTYLALSLVASLYDIENVFYRLGWNLGAAVSGLPNVVLPALVLLLSGAGAWAVQRRYEVRPPRLTDAEAS